MTNKDGVQIEKDVNNNKYTLLIPKVNPMIHAGTITIKASNIVNAIQHDINLNVLGKYRKRILRIKSSLYFYLKY